MAQLMELSDKDFKVSLVTMLSDVKKKCAFLINKKIGNVNG